MATPHVAGIAARCFASGECKLANGAANTQMFLNYVRAKYDSDPSYRWSTGSVSNSKYYGPWVWAPQW